MSEVLGLSYAQQQRNPTRHLVGLTVVVLLHIVLGWALVNGLARKVVEVIKGPLETKIIEEVKPPPPPPENLLPPPKNFAPPPPSFVPPPEVVVSTPSPTPSISVTRETPPPAPPVQVAPPAPAAPPVARAAAKPAIANVAACAPKSEDYPAAAQRAEATGTTRIRFTIDAAGKLVKTEVAKSAGPTREHKQLDKVAESKLAGCTFTAGIDDNGRPVGGTFEAEYLWKLE